MDSHEESQLTNAFGESVVIGSGRWVGERFRCENIIVWRRKRLPTHRLQSVGRRTHFQIEVLLSIPQNEESVSNDEFSTLLPDVVPDWDPDWLNINPQTSEIAEKTGTSGRIIRRASRRSSILRLPNPSTQSSIECPNAGLSQSKSEDERTTAASSETSINARVDSEKPHESGPLQDVAVPVPKKKRTSSTERHDAKSLIPRKSDSRDKRSSKPAHDPPFAEQCQRYFNQVPSRFHTFPTKRTNDRSSAAVKRMPAAVKHPVPGSSSTGIKGNDSKDYDGAGKIFPPPNPRKVSTKFTNSSQQPKPALHKFTARPVPRGQGSAVNLPRAPQYKSVVYEERNGKTQQTLVNTHVGVPQSNLPGIRKIEVKPFSFAERDEKARKLRQEKLRQASEESVKFPAFTANPLPSYLAEKINVSAAPSKTLRKNEPSSKKAEKENVPSQD